jgi:hypothetical protein
MEQAFLDGIALDMQRNIASVRHSIRQAGQIEAAVQRVIAGVRTGESQCPGCGAIIGIPRAALR